MNQDLGHWVTSIDIPKEIFGFVYRITNLENNKMYIGKKLCTSVKKLPPLKGKTRKRHKKVETDWKTYTGSSPELNEDIKKLGKDKFKFEIIKFCTCKWELSYFEAKAQFEEDVLFKQDEYYNGIINLRIGRSPKESLEKFNLCQSNLKSGI
jgi:hypothetical protein